MNTQDRHGKVKGWGQQVGPPGRADLPALPNAILFLLWNEIHTPGYSGDDARRRRIILNRG